MAECAGALWRESVGVREVRKGLLELAGRCLVGLSWIGRWEWEMEFQGGKNMNQSPGESSMGEDRG